MPRTGTRKTLDRAIKQFNSKAVETPSGCWEWTDGTRDGYGQIIYSGERMGAHVFSFIVHNKKMPKGYVLHKCDVRHCCNPDHLYDGTPSQNARDRELRMSKESRRKRRVRY